MADGSEKAKPFGYVLVLRALAEAAVRVGGTHPAALRTLVILAQFFDKDGVCRLRQETLASALGITRQAINQHLKILVDAGLLSIEDTGGKLRTYRLITKQEAVTAVPGKPPPPRWASWDEWRSDASNQGALTLQEIPLQEEYAHLWRRTDILNLPYPERERIVLGEFGNVLREAGWQCSKIDPPRADWPPLWRCERIGEAS